MVLLCEKHVAPLLNVSDTSKLTVGYARVSTGEQKDDLKRQKEVLELFCSANGWEFQIIEDLGSGMNYKKKGLQQLQTAYYH